jgi:phosphoesterase RecJ-like protein
VTANPWHLDPTVAKQARRLLTGGGTVLLPTHQNVDADGLASALAMRLALAQLGVEGMVLISDGDLPSNLRFLPAVETVLRYGEDPLPAYDRLCLVDCADRNRLGNFVRDAPERVQGGVPIVNIDHHVTNDRYGAVNIVEPEAASTAEIVEELLRVWKTELTKPIAECLLAGIYGDTLGLRTPGTTSRTMRAAADLVDAGANPTPIVDNLFRLKPRSTVCLWERALAAVSWTGPLIWTELTKRTFIKCGAEASEAEGLVNFLAGTEGSLVAALLYEVDDGWRVSLRSLNDDVDVARIAAEFGGGGHPRAAGCLVGPSAEEKARFLARVAELAGESAGAPPGDGRP